MLTKHLGLKLAASGGRFAENKVMPLEEHSKSVAVATDFAVSICYRSLAAALRKIPQHIKMLLRLTDDSRGLFARYVLQQRQLRHKILAANPKANHLFAAAPREHGFGWVNRKLSVRTFRQRAFCL